MKKTVFLLIALILTTTYLYAQPVIVHIENKALKVKVSSHGAELQSIKSNKSLAEYLWQGDANYWADRAPIMFPVNVKFKDDRYTYKGVEYNMPKMGLAKICNFEIVELMEEEVSMLLKSNAFTLEKYPFPFQLKVTYRLKGKKLINEFVVENTGNETMYFALGGHPGFRFPIEEKSERSKNGFVFSKNYELNRTEIVGSLVQKNEIPLLENESGFAFSDDRIPNAGMFVKNMPSRKIGMCVIGKTEEINVDSHGGLTDELYVDNLPSRTIGMYIICQSEYITVDLDDFPNVNMWTPPGMPFACIEPMVGHHDLQDSPKEITKKTCLTTLAPGKKKKYSFSIIMHE